MLDLTIARGRFWLKLAKVSVWLAHQFNSLSSYACNRCTSNLKDIEVYIDKLKEKESHAHTSQP